MPRFYGQVTTASASEVPVNATAYTEQTTAAQRSVVSSSANDTAAGTGARTVKITYYTLAADGAIAGPFYETVTLNGTGAVNTVATNIVLVERLDVMTAGSGGVAAGIISLKAAAAGGGATIASIATGEVETFMAMHYVASGEQCLVESLSAAGGDAAMALLRLRVATYPLTVEKSVTEKLGVTLTISQTLVPLGVLVAGPARIRLMVAPANTNSQTTQGGFGVVDQV